MVKTIGVIGLGSIGMRHAKNLLNMGHRVFGFDTDPLIDHKLRENPNFQRWNRATPYSRPPEFIVIASPTNRHYDDIYACLQHNMNVFVEKPIAHSLEEPLDPSLLRQVKMVGYNLRFHGCVKKAKEWLDSGKIGKPIWANFTLGQHSEKPPYLRDGVILNWSHEIDLALYLLGDAEVAASSTRLSRPGTANSDVNVLHFQADDMTDILLTHHDGSRSTIHLDYITNPQKRYFKIAGHNGFIAVDFVNGVAILDRPKQDTECFVGGFDWNQTYIEEMQAFLDRCDGKETIGCTGEEGLKVLKICLEVRKQAGLV